jgi:CDP-diacylglycerol--glycerol-3-phosphate 3-phosphatidyltransferase
MSSRREFRTSGVLAIASSLRIVLAPAIMALVLGAGDDTGAATIIAAALFTIAALTDIIDGRLARRWQVTTTLGSFLDTTADKLLVTGALIALVEVGHASPWIATIIVARELVIMGLRGLVAADGLVMPPSMWGKLKTNIQFIAILLAILRLGDPVGGAFVDEWVMVVAALITVASGAEYLLRFAPVLRGQGVSAPPSVTAPHEPHAEPAEQPAEPATVAGP